MRPYRHSAGRYDRVSGGYYPVPYGYASDPGYMHVNAYYPEAAYYSGRAPRLQYVRRPDHRKREADEHGYEKPITAREREQQRQKEKQKHKGPDLQGKQKRSPKTKSNKKIQMYRSFNPLEPQSTADSSYPMYMVPKRKISYQNYMQESSFYGDEDDPTLESGSLGQGYHHWQHDPGLYRLRRSRHMSSSTHTSYENHEVGSDIEEETTFDTNFDEQSAKDKTAVKSAEKIEYANTKKDKIAVKTAEKVVYANTKKVRKDAVRAKSTEKVVYANSETIKKYEDEGTQTQSFQESNDATQAKHLLDHDETSLKRSLEYTNESKQAQNLNDEASIQKSESSNNWKEADYENTRAAQVSNSRNLEIDDVESRQSFDDYDGHVPKADYENARAAAETPSRNWEIDAVESRQSFDDYNGDVPIADYENVQLSTSKATEKAEQVPYENAETTKVPESDSFQTISYVNTGTERSENPPRKYVYEDIQTHTDQDIQASWTNIYDNINPSELVRTETQKKTESHYIHPTEGAHYQVTDLENVNRREYSELEMHVNDLWHGSRKELSGLETADTLDGENQDRRGYSEFETDSVNRKEYSELEHVIQEANRDFDRLTGEKLEQTHGSLAYAVSPTMDHFVEPYQSEANNVRIKSFYVFLEI